MSRRALHNPGAPISLRLSGMELTAFSISGLASYVLARDFDACFDLGHCGMEASRLRNVFLSHAHQDHSGGVSRHLALRSMTGASPSRVYCPEGSAEDLRGLLHAWAKLERRDRVDADAVVRPVRPGDRVELGRRAFVEVFEVFHRIESVGYTLVERRRTLRPEWVGRPGVEIGEAVRAGVDVHVEREHRRLTYVGDSTLATYDAAPDISDCDVLFIEATHLSDTPVDRAWAWGHTHLDELVALYRRAPERLRARHIVIKHFSVKYSHDDIAAAHAALPDGLRERVVMLA
ncbi:MAG: MBL fold metallo-hydrolase [Polyangiales bacterium]